MDRCAYLITRFVAEYQRFESWSKRTNVYRPPIDVFYQKILTELRLDPQALVEEYERTKG